MKSYGAGVWSNRVLYSRKKEEVQSMKDELTDDESEYENKMEENGRVGWVVIVKKAVLCEKRFDVNETRNDETLESHTPRPRVYRVAVRVTPGQAGNAKTTKDQNNPASQVAFMYRVVLVQTANWWRADDQAMVCRWRQDVVRAERTLCVGIGVNCSFTICN